MLDCPFNVYVCLNCCENKWLDNILSVCLPVIRTTTAFSGPIRDKMMKNVQTAKLKYDSYRKQKLLFIWAQFELKHQLNWRCWTRFSHGALQFATCWHTMFIRMTDFCAEVFTGDPVFVLRFVSDCCELTANSKINFNQKRFHGSKCEEKSSDGEIRAKAPEKA